VNRLPTLATPAPPDQEANVLRATGTDPNLHPARSALAPPLAPLAPKLALTADRPREGAMPLDSPTVPGGGGATPFADESLNSDECGREGLILGDWRSVNEETPGDRRRAFLYGEELVPKGKGRLPWRRRGRGAAAR